MGILSKKAGFLARARFRVSSALIYRAGMSASVSQMQHGLSVKTDRPCMNKVIWKLTVIAAKGQ